MLMFFFVFASFFLPYFTPRGVMSAINKSQTRHANDEARARPTTTRTHPHTPHDTRGSHGYPHRRQLARSTTTTTQQFSRAERAPLPGRCLAITATIDSHHHPRHAAVAVRRLAAGAVRSHRPDRTPQELPQSL